MARVLVSDKLEKVGLDALARDPSLTVDNKPGLKPDDQAAIIGAYDALIVRSATKVNTALLARAERLKLVIRAGIGVDNIDLAACKARGIVVENTPRGNVVSAAEHAIALMFALARQIPEASATTKRGVWEKTRFMGTQITGKTLGIIGTGNIGAVVVERALALKMRVVGFDPILTPEKARALGLELVELDALYAQADVITIHTPLLESTRNLLNDAAFAKMKPGVLVINAARGGLVDEDALLRAIEKRIVRGAALDVFAAEPVRPDHPLLAREEVVVTPHLGASTFEAQASVALEAAEQASAFFRDGTTMNVVSG